MSFNSVRGCLLERRIKAAIKYLVINDLQYKNYVPIGHSENKNMKHISSFENEVRPGTLMTVVRFSYSKQVLSSLVDTVAKYGHPV